MSNRQAQGDAIMVCVCDLRSPRRNGPLPTWVLEGKTPFTQRSRFQRLPRQARGSDEYVEYAGGVQQLRLKEARQAGGSKRVTVMRLLEWLAGRRYSSPPYEPATDGGRESGVRARLAGIYYDTSCMLRNQNNDTSPSSHPWQSVGILSCGIPQRSLNADWL